MDKTKVNQENYLEENLIFKKAIFKSMENISDTINIYDLKAEGVKSVQLVKG